MTVLFCCLFGALARAADTAALEEQYRLAAGDKVRVTVYGHEDLSGEFEVDASGRLALPLIQEVTAAALTLRELEQAITDRLQPDYLKNPRVNVEILNFRPFYIVGEVKTPGSYPYANGMTVINAVAVAGGFTYRARKGSITIRRGAGADQTEIRAQEQTPVLPGDVIEVPERFF
jgi:polysaccharide export outer membrane protein